MGIPFQVWHQQQQCVVCEGRTSLAASQVPCDPWFVNQGALYMGETYVLAVPTGHGWRATAVSFVVGEVGQLTRTRTLTLTLTLTLTPTPTPTLAR